LAKRGVARRGRTTVALALVGFVLISASVIWRRSVGIEQARAIRDLDRVRLQLEGERARLDRDLREAKSRARVAPIAERRLGMRVPTDTQVVILRRSADEDR
jgi:cell division protein FtsL